MKYVLEDDLHAEPLREFDDAWEATREKNRLLALSDAALIAELGVPLCTTGCRDRLLVVVDVETGRALR